MPLRKFLTMDNLRKHQIVVVDWCCMCMKSVETTNQLHLHFNIARAVYHGFMYICDVALELWGMVLCLFGNQRFMPKVLLICCLVGKDGLVDIIM